MCTCARTWIIFFLFLNFMFVTQDLLGVVNSGQLTEKQEMRSPRSGRDSPNIDLVGDRGDKTGSG